MARSPKLLVGRDSNSAGFGLVEVIVVSGIISIVGLGLASMITNMQRSTSQVQNAALRTSFEQQLSSLYSNSALCTCGLGGLSIPAAGEVAVAGLKSACAALTNDFYLDSGPGFSLSPTLLVDKIAVSAPLLVSGSDYTATLSIVYGTTGGSLGLRQRDMFLRFQKTAAAGPPFVVQACSVDRAIGASGWTLTGNTGTDATNFIGTSDDVDVFFRRNNIVSGALRASTTSYGVNSLPAASTGIENTAVGTRTLSATTTGARNTAIGFNALKDNTTGSDNVAVGKSVMGLATAGTKNVGVGHESLFSTTDGIENLAMGYQALYSNTGGLVSVLNMMSMTWSDVPGGGENFFLVETASGRSV